MMNSLTALEQDRVFSVAVAMAMVAESGLASANLRSIAKISGVRLSTIEHSFPTVDDLVVGAAISTAQASLEGADSWPSPDELAISEMSLLQHLQRNRRFYGEAFVGRVAPRVHAGMGTLVGPLDEATTRFFLPPDLSPEEMSEVRAFVSERARRLVIGWVTEPDRAESPEMMHEQVRRFVGNLIANR